MRKECKICWKNVPVARNYQHEDTKLGMYLVSLDQQEIAWRKMIEMESIRAAWNVRMRISSNNANGNYI